MTVAAVAAMAGCRKTTQGVTGITYYPVMTMNGESYLVHQKGEPYEDEGCSAVLNGKDVTENYNISKHYEQLIVSPIELTITVKEKSEAYNGKELKATDDDYVLKGKLLDGDKLNINIEGSITDVGETKASIIYTSITNSEGKDVTSNYRIYTNDGYIKLKLTF